MMHSSWKETGRYLREVEEILTPHVLQANQAQQIIRTHLYILMVMRPPQLAQNGVSLWKINFSWWKKTKLRSEERQEQRLICNSCCVSFPLQSKAARYLSPRSSAQNGDSPTPSYPTRNNHFHSQQIPFVTCIMPPSCPLRLVPSPHSTFGGIPLEFQSRNWLSAH